MLFTSRQNYLDLTCLRAPFARNTQTPLLANTRLGAYCGYCAFALLCIWSRKHHFVTSICSKRAKPTVNNVSSQGCAGWDGNAGVHPRHGLFANRPLIRGMWHVYDLFWFIKDICVSKKHAALLVVTAQAYNSNLGSSYSAIS